jgi:hypothetical protein
MDRFPDATDVWVMSDGEFEFPDWDAFRVGHVGVVFHFICLGAGSDRTKMQKMAADGGGTFFQMALSPSSVVRVGACTAMVCVKFCRICNDASVRRNVASAVNLAGINLAGINLAGTNLTGTNLAGTNLAGANLAGAKLAGANVSGRNRRPRLLSLRHNGRSLRAMHRLGRP